MSSTRKRQREEDENSLFGKRKKLTYSSIVTIMCMLNIMMMITCYVFLLCSDNALGNEELSMKAQLRDPQLYTPLKWSVEEKRFSDHMFYRLFQRHRD